MSPAATTSIAAKNSKPPVKLAVKSRMAPINRGAVAAAVMPHELINAKVSTSNSRRATVLLRPTRCKCGRRSD